MRLCDIVGQTCSCALALTYLSSYAKMKLERTAIQLTQALSTIITIISLSQKCVNIGFKRFFTGD